MFSQIAFIIWRESVEALLVIGILAAWIAANPAARAGRRWLWGGVAAGLAAAIVLAFGLTRFADALPPAAQDWFQTALVLVAGGLIVQMVLWMRRHGRTLKNDLHQGLDHAADQGRWWGVATLAAIAVAREGSEAVVFLYGTLSGAAPDARALAAVATGFALALASYAVLQAGGRYLSWRVFFRVTEVMLLLLACALFTTGADHLVSLGVLPMTEPLWDSSALLDDMGRFGGAVAGLTGYRAQPDTVTLSVWVLYWAAIWFALARPWAARPRPV